MLKIFRPKLYIESIWDLDLDYIKNLNIKGFIIDVDNTLIKWDQKYVSKNVINWLRRLHMQGFKICLVSNNTKNRVAVFSKTLDIPAISVAAKPMSKSFRLAMKIMNTTRSTTAVIGDQIFTDIFGGNRLNLFTILVPPLGNKELLWTKTIRQIEKLILKSI